MTIGNTQKLQIMTVVTSIALLAGFSILPAVSAHSTSGTYAFPSASEQVCIYDSNLNGVELDGSINQGSDVADIFESGMDEIGDNTDFNPYIKTTSCSSGDSVVTGWYFSDSDDKASTTILYNNSYKYIKVSTNTGANMISSGTCASNQNVNMYYVANHEFGHFAGLSIYHHSSTSGHTLNEATCSSDWGQIGSGDETQINGWY